MLTAPPRPAAEPVAERRRRVPRLLALLGAVVGVILLLPVAFLVNQARQAGWSTLTRLMFRHLTVTLLWNTVRLSIAVTILSAVAGVGAAWCIERTNLPGRRIWAVLVVLPVAIPDFVVGYTWISIAPAVHGYWGAVLVMTLGLYPLVFLPVAAALRSTDPALEEVARSLGLGRLETFTRVTLRQIRPALLGGCLVVSLAILAEFGAFEILRFQTFTTVIFSEFQVAFDAPAASALALVLVALSLVALGGEAAATGRGRVARTGPLATRIPARARLGRATVPAVAGMAVLIGLSVGVPVGTIIYWLVRGGSSTLPGISIMSATWHTAAYAAGAALLSTAAALPVALLSIRHRGRLSMLLERSTFIVQALPGLVIALTLVLFSVRYARWVYQSSELLVLAYAILFFPLALIAVRASVAQAQPRLEEVARSLGLKGPAVLARVTLPLIGPGLAASFCLVFLSAVTELTATLLLIPTGVHTLATEFWAFTSNVSYGAAAPYAAMLVAIAAVPSYVLSRWFDRLPARASVASAAL
jgi:iron(III) transport system permease protein